MLPLGQLGRGFGNEWSCRLSREEQKTMMTLWCMFRSPLMVGAELTKLDAWTLQLLTNEDLLSLMGRTRRGMQIMRDSLQAIWKNVDTETGGMTVALFNLSDEKRRISMSLDEAAYGQTADKGVLYELWDKTREEMTQGLIASYVEPHGVRVYRIEA